MEDVLTYSTLVQLEAQELLAKTNLLNELSKFGVVKLIGSLSFYLMFDRDIDLVVNSDQPRKSAVAALECLIKTEWFSRYEFGDYVQFPRANRPYVIF